MDDKTGGDPEGQFKFVRPSLRSLTEQLDGRASGPVIRKMLGDLGVFLRVNVKRFVGAVLNKKKYLTGIQIMLSASHDPVST